MQSQRNALLDEELQEGDVADGPAEEEEEVLSMQSGESRGRGRPAMPICWSRVLHVTAGSSIQVKAHQVAVDIMM